MTESNGVFHPSRPLYRYVVLAVAGLLTFGSYFAYDSIGAISTLLIAALKTDRESISTLYSMYSIAAIASVLAGGILIDRIGTRRASLVFSALLTFGAVIVAFAPNIYVAYFGRLVFGAGSESLIVAQNAILARWFRGKELAMSFGVTLMISRLGTLFSFNIEALIGNRYGYLSALWVAAALCVVSLLGNLVYFVLDKRGERALGLKEVEAGDKIVFSDIKKFHASFWYVALLCVTFYSAIFPFTALSTDFFNEKWKLPLSSAPEGAGLLYAAVYDFLHMFTTAPGTTSIIIFASMCLAPFAGRVVDKVGRRASLMMAGSLLMIPAYLTMAFTTVPPYLPMIVLGAAFVLVPAAMWPAVPLVVEKDRVGTAFGLMTMIQNIGLALFPWLNGKLRDATHDYQASLVMFATLGACGLLFAVLLWKSDRTAGRVLEKPGEEAAA
ncbi:MAG: MFS transporter [Acidobacteria bacterium]|nr:MFS transporter [Acidobacteriota bacterium]